MLPRKSLRRADVVMSCLLIGLGAFVIFKAIQMPWASQRTGGSVQWFLSPGLFPTVIGTLLILFSARVLVQAIREEGQKGLLGAMQAWIVALPRNRAVHRVAVIVALMSIYVFAGIGKINYFLASSVFLFVSIALFWWPTSQTPVAAKVVITTLVAAATPVVVGYVFTTFLYVPMP